MGVSGLGPEGEPGGPRDPEEGPGGPDGGPGVPKGSPGDLDGGPGVLKESPRCPDGGPGVPKGSHGRLDGGPRDPQECHGGLDGGPGLLNGGPGGLDGGPRIPKESPGRLCGGPGQPKGGPGGLDGGPGVPKESPGGLDGGPGQPKGGPGGLDGGPGVPKESPGGLAGGPGQPARAEQVLLQALQSLRSDGPAAVRAVLEAAPPWLPGTLGAGPAALGELAAALGEYAAPPGREQDGAEPPGRDRECAAAAAERAEQAGAVFVLLLKKLEDAKSQEHPGAPALRRVKGHMYIFAVTHLVERPWTTPRSRAVALELLELLVKAAGCGSVPEFLRGKDGDEEGAFGAVMGLLKKELTKDTWKRNPATKHVFSWTLPHVTRPWLGPHLERVLPPALLISDDFQEENKVLGVQCLHHIVLNVPGADLCQFNRAQVVFHALYNHLYSREAPLIQAVLLCLLDLLPVLERSQRHQGQVGAPSQWDEVLQLVLTHMEAEHRLALRRVYAGTLPAFVGRLGILVVRHLKRLERVILGYLEVSDGPEEEARLGILETLQCTIEHAWPRMPCRLPVLLKALLRLIWDVHTDKGPTPEPVRAALLQRATQCLILLDHCSQGQVKVLLEGVYSSCEENRVRECIRKVQEST